MGLLRNIITPLHQKTPRDYLGRMKDQKVACMEVAKRYDREYWDGLRRFGYGGYSYDGRFESVARALIETYQLSSHSAILDVGCGKAFLLYELQKLLPGISLVGIDYSSYALSQAKQEIKKKLFLHDARTPLPFGEGEFDLVVSFGVLHNFAINELKVALSELQRVAREKYLVVESYRNNQELFNLQCWALTCESFFSPKEWVWLFEQFGYLGDYEFIYFEGEGDA